MYEVCTTAVGGRMVTVALDDRVRVVRGGHPRGAHAEDANRLPDQSPQPDRPNHPRSTTLRALAQDVAPAILFVDEAYADFAGETLIDAATLASLPNLVVGRTFAKAYGLAGLRTGALVAHAGDARPAAAGGAALQRQRVGAAALPVALADRAYRDWYVEQAAASRALLTEACARLGLQTWPSAANFVLVRVADAPATVNALAARGVLVRDRSATRGAGGCIRITAGIVEDTRHVISALEELLCAAR